MFSLINKRNFIRIPRLLSEAVLNARRGEVTTEFNKISLPSGNLDFAQSLRYFASLYTNKASAKGLDLSQNQDFNLEKIFI